MLCLQGQIYRFADSPVVKKLLSMMSSPRRLGTESDSCATRILDLNPTIASSSGRIPGTSSDSVPSTNGTMFPLSGSNSASISFAPSTISNSKLLPPSFATLSARSRWKSHSQFSVTSRNLKSCSPCFSPASQSSTSPSVTVNIASSSPDFCVPVLSPTDTITSSQNAVASTSTKGPRSVGSQYAQSDLNEFCLYKPLDTALHSQYLFQEEIAKKSQEHEEALKQKGEQQLSKGELPFGFFDDAEKDAAVRGIEGPTKRQQKEIEFEGVKIDSLLDVVIERQELIRTLKDQKQYEYEEQEQQSRQTDFAEKLESLKNRRRQRFTSSTATENTEARRETPAGVVKSENLQISVELQHGSSPNSLLPTSGDAAGRVNSEQGVSEDVSAYDTMGAVNSNGRNQSGDEKERTSSSKMSEMMSSVRAALYVKMEKRERLLRIRHRESGDTSGGRQRDVKKLRTDVARDNMSHRRAAPEDEGSNSESDAAEVDNDESLLDWRSKAFG
eukprot:GHVQ01023023.1.p1 GENE.GHVQ01023023.1~~GHVQ01023023.1.p1  ORF type:complete len:501 (+),score=78.23 GHVQ01023023.1:798-2300(+)